MLPRHASKLLFGAAFFLSAACWALPPLPDGPYPPSARSTETEVTVKVVWLPTFDAVNAMCTFQISNTKAVVGCYNPVTNTIYAVEPRNFNDHYLLEILGHEFWHALGARHPAL